MRPESGFLMLTTGEQISASTSDFSKHRSASSNSQFTSFPCSNKAAAYPISCNSQTLHFRSTMQDTPRLTRYCAQLHSLHAKGHLLYEIHSFQTQNP